MHQQRPHERFVDTGAVDGGDQLLRAPPRSSDAGPWRDSAQGRRGLYALVRVDLRVNDSRHRRDSSATASFSIDVPVKNSATERAVEANGISEHEVAEGVGVDDATLDELVRFLERRVELRYVPVPDVRSHQDGNAGATRSESRIEGHTNQRVVRFATPTEVPAVALSYVLFAFQPNGSELVGFAVRESRQHEEVLR